MYTAASLCSQKVYQILIVCFFSPTYSNPVSYHVRSTTKQQLLQHIYKNTGVKFQPSQPEMLFQKRKAYFLLFFFFFKDTVLHLLKSALKYTWVSDSTLGMETLMPVWNIPLETDQCCQGDWQNRYNVAQENAPLQLETGYRNQRQIFSI